MRPGEVAAQVEGEPGCPEPVGVPGERGAGRRSASPPSAGGRSSRSASARQRHGRRRRVGRRRHRRAAARSRARRAGRPAGRRRAPRHRTVAATRPASGPSGERTAATSPSRSTGTSTSVSPGTRWRRPRSSMTLAEVGREVVGGEVGVLEHGVDHRPERGRRRAGRRAGRVASRRGATPAAAAPLGGRRAASGGDVASERPVRRPSASTSGSVATGSVPRRAVPGGRRAGRRVGRCRCRRCGATARSRVAVEPGGVQDAVDAAVAVATVALPRRRPARGPASATSDAPAKRSREVLRRRRRPPSGPSAGLVEADPPVPSRPNSTRAEGGALAALIGRPTRRPPGGGRGSRRRTAGAASRRCCRAARPALTAVEPGPVRRADVDDPAAGVRVVDDGGRRDALPGGPLERHEHDRVLEPLAAVDGEDLDRRGVGLEPAGLLVGRGRGVAGLRAGGSAATAAAS